MSYESENTLAEGSKISDVREFIKLLGYKKSDVIKSDEVGRIEVYWYFDEADYRSWTGVELGLYKEGPSIVVSTRTRIARSYYDLAHQNRTISQLRKFFGGKFRTDEGSGRYLRPESGPPSPSSSGCHIAFGRFGHNLITAKMYLDARSFPEQYQGRAGKLWIELGMSPLLLSNNMLLPFIVAALEDYFKSTFIALLRYSHRKQSFFKSLRLQGDHLVAISDGKSVEEQVVETLPFQRISAVTRHFEALEPKLDLRGVLRKPYRRRKQSLYDLIESLVITRHNFIHRTQQDRSLTEERMDDLIYYLDAAVTRVYKRITAHYKWQYDRGWFLGRRPPKTRAQQSAPADAAKRRG